MENTKKINFSKRSECERNINDIPSCPFWILGDENSANNDLEKVVEIVDEENQDNSETV